MFEPAHRKLFNRTFHPFRDLKPAELAALSVERGDDAHGRMLWALQSADVPSAVRLLLVGPRGSGKTHELRRLAAALAAVPPGGAPDDGFVPVLIDIGTKLPDRATTAVWLPRVIAAVRACRQEWGEPVDDQPPLAVAKLGLGDHFSGLTAGLRAAGLLLPLAQLFPHLAAAAPALSAGATVAEAAAKALDLAGDAAREAQRAQASSGALRGLRDVLVDELAALQRAAGRPVCLLLDGLDKCLSAEAVFSALSDAELLEELPCGLVLTGPTALLVDTRFGANQVPGAIQPQHLPVVHVVDRAGALDVDGAQPLVDLFHKRWAAAALGPCPFDDAALVELARLSSGLPRAFLELVNEAYGVIARAGRQAVTAADVEAAARPARQLLEATLNEKVAEVLLHALDTGMLPTEQAHADLLMRNMLLTRHNGEAWCRPNELLIPKLSAVAQRRAAEDAGR
jgi:hypothetical protein